MASARLVLGFIGLVFILIGAYVAAAFDSLLGLGFLVVGAFLLILPFMTARADE